VEDPVDRDGELDHAEVRAEVATGPGGRLDEQITDLPGQAGELILAESLQVLGAVNALQHGHGVLLMCCAGLMGNASRAEVNEPSLRGRASDSSSSPSSPRHACRVVLVPGGRPPGDPPLTGGLHSPVPLEAARPPSPAAPASPRAA